MIKGKIEDEIRSSYFGGNVDVFINDTEDMLSYYYDMNSQYPNAMLEDMPIGNPIFTTEKDLDKIFGFVYGTIKAPSEEILRIPIIQYRDPITRTVSCPRGLFKRMIFTEEIKAAIKYGYSIEIEYGYNFKRSKDLFKDYVTTFYNLKKHAKVPVERYTVKLMFGSAAPP
jgi:DNA polymerase type B, organellar and viral